MRIYISNLFIPTLHGCDGPIALCSTVVMYFDIYIGVCHPLIVYTMYVEFNEGVIMMREIKSTEKFRIQTQNLLNTSQMLLPLSHWAQSRGAAHKLHAACVKASAKLKLFPSLS